MHSMRQHKFLLNKSHNKPLKHILSIKELSDKIMQSNQNNYPITHQSIPFKSLSNKVNPFIKIKPYKSAQTRNMCLTLTHSE